MLWLYVEGEVFALNISNINLVIEIFINQHYIGRAQMCLADGVIASNKESKYIFILKPKIPYLAKQSKPSSLIHFACIGVAPLGCSRCGVNSRGGATLMQVKWIKLDLNLLHCTENLNIQNVCWSQFPRY